MAEILKKHIRKFTSINDQEFERIVTFFEIIEVRKKDILHKAQSICRYHYFVME